MRYEVFFTIETDQPDTDVNAAVDDAWYGIEEALGVGPDAQARKRVAPDRVEYVSWPGWDDEMSESWSVRRLP